MTIVGYFIWIILTWIFSLVSLSIFSFRHDTHTQTHDAFTYLFGAVDSMFRVRMNLTKSHTTFYITKNASMCACTRNSGSRLCSTHFSSFARMPNEKMTAFKIFILVALVMNGFYFYCIRIPLNLLYNFILIMFYYMRMNQVNYLTSCGFRTRHLLLVIFRSSFGNLLLWWQRAHMTKFGFRAKNTWDKTAYAEWIKFKRAKLLNCERCLCRCVQRASDGFGAGCANTESPTHPPQHRDCVYNVPSIFNEFRWQSSIFVNSVA